MNILEKIKELRNAKGISQYDMADKLGIGQSTYFQIEKGKTELTVSRLYDISSVLDVSIAELLDIEVKNIDQSKRIQELERENELYRTSWETIVTLVKSIFGKDKQEETEEEKTKRLENFDNAKELLKDFKL